MLSGMNITTIAFVGLLIFQTVQPFYRPPSQSSDIEGLVRALQAIQLQHTAELERLKARMERLEKVVKKLCEDVSSAKTSSESITPRRRSLEESVRSHANVESVSWL